MAKVDSRLPFLRSNRPKAYQETVYIISENESKLLDYSAAAEGAKKVADDAKSLTSLPVKNGLASQTNRGLKAPNPVANNKITSSGVKAHSDFSKKANSTPAPKTNSRLAGPQSQLRIPGTTTLVCPKASQISQQTNNASSYVQPQAYLSHNNRKHTSSAGSVQTTNDSPIDSLVQSNHSLSMISKSAPVIPPKPVLPASKTSRPMIPSKISALPSCSKLSTPNQSKAQACSNASAGSRSECRLTKPVERKPVSESQKSGNISSPPKYSTSSHHLDSTSNSPTSVSTASRLSTSKHQLQPPLSDSRQMQTPQTSVPSPPAQGKTTPKLKFQKCTPENQSKPSPHSKIAGLSKSAGHMQKPSVHLSRLSAPSKHSNSLRKPVSAPKTVGNDYLQQSNLLMTTTKLEMATEVSTVVTDQCASLLYASVPVTPPLSCSQRITSHVSPLVELVHLHTVSSAPSVSVASAAISSEADCRDSCQVIKEQTFCGPCVIVSGYDDAEEVFETEPAIADAQVTQCYSYLQQADPSSYRKQLLNSFTVKEQLSPTAENHARHIASCLPQPWLSVDLIDSNGSSDAPPQLLIPEPPAEDFDKSKCKLQSIVEGVEPITEGPAVPLSPPLPVEEESVDKSTQIVNKHPQKSPSLFGNFFSKIGGRRILGRPQESPPRARKSLTSTTHKGEAAAAAAVTSLNRRKLSPKTRRRDTKTTRQTAQVELTNSPKHKPKFQDDSPIRCKEAYYGGAHLHMPKPSSTSSSVPEASEGSISANNLQGEFNSDVFTPENLPHPSQHHTSLKRSDTPINDLSSMCRDEHMSFYNGSYRPIRTLPLPARKGQRSSSSSSAAAMASIPVMSRSLTRKKKQKGSVDNGARFKTNYSSALRMGLPPCPELPNVVLEQGSSALSKVTVAVRLKSHSDTSANAVSSYITADPSRGQLILRDPSNESNMAPSCRRQLAAAPKFFAFDTVFGADAMQMGVCKDTVLEILQSVLQGSDGCVTSFGQNRTGKSRSLIGDDSSCADFGIIPAAISWLYHLIEQQKSKTGARFSIRISALEIRGKNEELTDLLAHCTPGTDAGHSEKIHLTSTDVYGAQVENLNEMRAPDVDHAGHYLDAALTTSYNLTEKSESKSAHFLFTLHIYQHHVESKPSPGGALVAGGRSRLHFIDIGPCAKSSSDGSALTLAALGSAITALLNGQRQFPQKESKLATLLRDSVGHHNCRTCILVHISTQPSLHSETLHILQLAARIHRMKVRRRNKICSNSSDDTGSTSSNVRRRRGIRMGTSASLSDPDVSSSEQSIDTVIYVPGNRQRHRQQPSNLYKPNQMPKPHTPSHEASVSGLANGCSNVQPSPYRVSGATKKRLSDDETSSEGRRRMPRTNARVWPRANHTDNEIWLDAAPVPPVPRDQWHIAGNASPAITHNHSYYSNGVVQQQQHYQQPQQNHYAFPSSAQPPQWLSLAQYNGHPQQIAQITTGAHTHSPSRQAWADAGETKGGYTEVSKQELWVDGPTAFRKNLEGLTHNLHKDQLSPTKRHQRHHPPNQSADRGEKSKHHQRTGSRKHRDNSKHCHQCGADIKKEQKPSLHPSKCEEKTTTESKSIEEPTLSVKPFVKDWVLRHSKNNTPTKATDVYDGSEVNGVSDNEGIISDKHNRAKLIEEETLLQETLQLTVDLEEELSCLPNLPCSDSLMNDTSDMERQDDVHIDDSVSNVTADDRVGFESKEGSSFDENSLSEEVVEVCDAACQTEFTDSDSLSVQSNSISNDLSLDNIMVRPVSGTANRNLHKRESTEAFLNATLQGVLLRKPDGASDPSLHKELLSPSVERKTTEMTAPPVSSTLPRNAFLQSPKSSLKTPQADPQTIRLQPYLSLPKSSIKQPPPERTNSKPQSKLKKMSLSKQNSVDGQDACSSDKSLTSVPKKSKGSLLPGLRFSSKPKEAKTASAQPSALPKKSEPAKKEKKSLLQAPSKVKSIDLSDNKKQTSRIAYKGVANFDVTSSPYRQYVLPKPSYADSEVCSNNSSCPSHPLAHNKHSVSSGYESMTHNSAEDMCQPAADTPVRAEDNKGDVWVDPASQSDSDVLRKVSQQRHEESQLSDNVTRQARLHQLLYQQNMLKREMAEAKSRLMVPTSAWNYDSSAPSPSDLHVASQRDRRKDEGYIEALEKETSTLQRRVDACKSRIMFITSIF